MIFHELDEQARSLLTAEVGRDPRQAQILERALHYARERLDQTLTAEDRSARVAWEERMDAAYRAAEAALTYADDVQDQAVGEPWADWQISREDVRLAIRDVFQGL